MSDTKTNTTAALAEISKAHEQNIATLKSLIAGGDGDTLLLQLAINNLQAAKEKIDGHLRKLAEKALADADQKDLGLGGAVKVAIIILALVLGLTVKAGITLNGGSVYVTTATNSALASTPAVTVTYPQTTAIWSGITNPATQTTNVFAVTWYTNGILFYGMTNFVFNAASNGLSAATIANPLSWTNTFPAQTITAYPLYFMQVQPQLGSNTFSFQSQ